MKTVKLSQANDQEVLESLKKLTGIHNDAEAIRFAMSYVLRKEGSAPAGKHPLEPVKFEETLATFENIVAPNKNGRRIFDIIKIPATITA